MIVDKEDALVIFLASQNFYLATIFNNFLHKLPAILPNNI